MVSRRDFLKLAGLGAGGALLNACAPGLVGRHAHGGSSLATATPVPTATAPATRTPLPAQTAVPTGATRLL